MLYRAATQAVSRLPAQKYLPGILDPDGETTATAGSLDCSMEIPWHMEEAGATEIFKWLVDL